VLLLDEAKARRPVWVFSVVPEFERRLPARQDRNGRCAGRHAALRTAICQVRLSARC
jgi:hypothetical protein